MPSLNDLQYKALLKQSTAGDITETGPVRSRLGEAASVNAANLKNSKAKVFSYEFANLNSTTWRFVRLYNKATAPSPPSDVALLVLKIAIPPGGVRTQTFIRGLDFANGLGIAVTGAVADNDATAVAANEVVGSVYYQ